MVDRFLELPLIANKIEKEINFGNIDNAISHYYEFSEGFDALDYLNDENFSKFFEIRNQLIVYFQINEIETLLNSKKNISIIGKKIKHLENLDFRDIPNKKIKNKIKILFERYHSLVFELEFNDQLNKIYRLVAEERYESALKKIPELISKLNQIEKHKSNRELFSSINNLKSHITKNILANDAYYKFLKNK